MRRNVHAQTLVVFEASSGCDDILITVARQLIVILNAMRQKRQSLQAL